MQRRAFLQSAGLALGALALDPRIALAEADAAHRFDAAIARHPWLLGWRNAAPLGRWQAATLEGDWPAALQGTLYRTGPGLFSRGSLRYRHWFDGDGLLQAWRFDGAGIQHHARFIPTGKFIAEERAGRFLRPAIGTRVPGAAGIRNSDDLSTANTAVVEHAGLLHALWEGGSPFALDPVTLAARGQHSWGPGMESLPFSAHPMLDAGGRLWNFGLSGSSLLVWQIGRDGRAEAPHVQSLPFPGYLHAFSMNERYLAFVLMPFVLDADLGDTPYFEALRWQPGRGCRALVLDKHDLGRERWFSLPAGAAYHFGPLRQQGNTLLLSACWHDDGEAVQSPLRDAMAGEPLAQRPSPGRLQPIALHLDSGRAELLPALALDVDFPVWDSAGDGRRLFAPLNTGTQEHPYFDALLHIDMEQGVLDRWQAGPGLMLEEQRYVADPSGRGAGWLLGTVLDYQRRRSGLVVFDADRLGAGPRAMAWLPQALPLGFHGWFSPRA